MRLFKSKDEKLNKNNPNEMYYDIKALSNLKYVKVVYLGLDNNYHEIKTDVKFIGEVLISLYFSYSYDFNINYPQEVKLKMVTSDAMYVANAVLQEIKKVDKTVYFSVIPPVKMVRRQERRFSRANLNRYCVLNTYDEKGRGKVYLTKVVNISGSGILIQEPEKFENDETVELIMSAMSNYSLLVILETDIILKLSARYIRYTDNEGTLKYAFQFQNIKQKNIDIICKYVTEEQVRQLRLHQKVKNR